MSNDGASGRLLPALAVTGLFAVLAATALSAGFGEATGFPADASVVHNVGYALFNLEPRGTMFVAPGEPVYEGMIIGEHNRDTDLEVNPTKTKKLSNMRASGRDENVILTPHHVMTLEASINFIRDDELVEITPKALRMRKRVLLSADRKKLR